MMCCHCSGNARKHGRDRSGNQRYRCRNPKCGRTFLEERERPLGSMRLSEDKAILCLKMLLECSSIRAVERITGVHRDTIMRLVVEAGERCRRMMEARLQNVPVNDVECDEMWGFVGCKERTKKRLNIRDRYRGDAYTYVAIERTTKLVVAWHLGRRDSDDTRDFLEKLNLATAGQFQLSTDGWQGYIDHAHTALGTRAAFGTIIKAYKQTEGIGRYSPPQVISVKRQRKFGYLEREIGTSIVERNNLTMRMHIKRLARLTLCYSKKWENLRAALGLHFAWYNFCRTHGAHRVTPAMENGLASEVWSLERLLLESATFN